MKQVLHILALIGLPLLLHAQGNLRNEGAFIRVNSGNNLRVEGNVDNNANGTITNEGNIYLDGNWTQIGATTAYTGAGWIWLEGTGNQSFSSVSPLTVQRLRVDNNNRLVLGSDLTVANEVDLMSNGKVELGTNNLTLNATATFSNYGTSAFVVTNSTGTLQRQVDGTNVIFPIGNSTYNPAILNNSGVADNFSLRVEEQVFDEGTTGTVITSNVVDRTWLIEENVIGGSNVTLTLQWEQADEMVSFDRSTSGITHHLSGTLWDNPSSYTAATNVSGTIWSQTRSGFTSFSPFVIRDTDVDLPIELLNFEAERINANQVNLDWATALEINNDGFEVQRMFDHGSNFEKIGFVKGQGTSTTTSYYDFLDNNNYHGLSYYRLKQLDNDGNFTYSDIRVVAGEGKPLGVNLSPIPASDYIVVRLEGIDRPTTAHFSIIDVLGKEYLNFNKKVLVTEQIQINEIADLPSGSYILLATFEGSHQQVKFVKK